nr:granulocyte-macrophage colony-stimulating factor isoform X1 [Oryctolagus cuniculus]
MWLQNLFLLGSVVCTISAPTHQPNTVSQPLKHVDAIKEARIILSRSNDSAAVPGEMVEVVSEMFDPQLAARMGASIVLPQTAPVAVTRMDTPTETNLPADPPGTVQARPAGQPGAALEYPDFDGQPLQAKLSPNPGNFL